MVQARLGRLVFGATDPRAGAAGSAYSLLDHPAHNHAVPATAGVLAEDARSVIDSFIRALRNRPRQSLEDRAEAEVGERIRIITGLGMTETAPSCTFAVGTDVKSGWIGLPVPGVEVKLVPNAEDSGKTEIRFRGPNVMPGYWRAPAETAAAFDDEGFYKTGDAVLMIDPADPGAGLAFDGRIAEDFKLSTGTFVSVGPLRAKVTQAGDPLVQDVVVAGLNHDDLGLLIFPRIEEARRKFGLPAEWGAAQVIAHHDVHAFFQDLVDRLWAAGTGSANRPARAVVLVEPPSIDRGEVTDKGSINQRAVLAHRAELVEAMYSERGADPYVFRPREGTQQ